MTKFLGAAALVFSLFLTSQANAQNANACLDIDGLCTTSTTLDGGATSKVCTNSTQCNCEYVAGCYQWALKSGSCWSLDGTWSDYGAAINGKRCCVRDGAICPPANVAHQQEDDLKVESTQEGLESVFGSMTNQSGVHWGWVGTTIKSPSAGRTTAAKAKLDACLFYSDVDSLESAAGSSNQTRWEYCVGSTYGCANTMKNDHCESNGASVCIDRCDCVYSGATGSDGCQGY